MKSGQRQFSNTLLKSIAPLLLFALSDSVYGKTLPAKHWPKGDRLILFLLLGTFEIF